MAHDKYMEGVSMYVIDLTREPSILVKGQLPSTYLARISSMYPCYQYASYVTFDRMATDLHHFDLRAAGLEGFLSPLGTLAASFGLPSSRTSTCHRIRCVVLQARMQVNFVLCRILLLTKLPHPSRSRLPTYL